MWFIIIVIFLIKLKNIGDTFMSLGGDKTKASAEAGFSYYKIQNLSVATIIAGLTALETALIGVTVGSLALTIALPLTIFALLTFYFYRIGQESMRAAEKKIASRKEKKEMLTDILNKLEELKKTKVTNTQPANFDDEIKNLKKFRDEINGLWKKYGDLYRKEKEEAKSTTGTKVKNFLFYAIGPFCGILLATLGFVLFPLTGMTLGIAIVLGVTLAVTVMALQYRLKNVVSKMDIEMVELKAGKKISFTSAEYATIEAISQKIMQVDERIALVEKEITEINQKVSKIEEKIKEQKQQKGQIAEQAKEPQDLLVEKAKLESARTKLREFAHIKEQFESDIDRFYVFEQRKSQPLSLSEMEREKYLKYTNLLNDRRACVAAGTILGILAALGIGAIVFSAGIAVIPAMLLGVLIAPITILVFIKLYEKESLSASENLAKKIANKLEGTPSSSFDEEPSIFQKLQQKFGNFPIGTVVILTLLAAITLAVFPPLSLSVTAVVALVAIGLTLAVTCGAIESGLKYRAAKRREVYIELKTRSYETLSPTVRSELIPVTVPGFSTPIDSAEEKASAPSDSYSSPTHSA